MSKFARFQETVTSADEICAVIGEPIAPVKAKVLDQLDEVCLDFIARSPFLVLATYGADGHIDLSPKGDPPGFVKVLAEHYLAIPDRPGNRRIDTFHNLLENPQVGLLFLIPGKTETLRLSGEARVVRDFKLRESMAVGGKVPEFVMVVYVDRAFMHCPKCMHRSKLWQPDQWPNSESLPDIGQAMIKHAKLEMTPDELEALATREGLLELY